MGLKLDGSFLDRGMLDFKTIKPVCVTPHIYLSTMGVCPMHEVYVPTAFTNATASEDTISKGDKVYIKTLI